MTRRTYVDITPDTNLIESFQAQEWRVPYAIAEAVDNSFGEERGNASRVHIIWDPKQRNLTILDDGAGMKDPADLFQLGKTQGRSVRDIGKYGYGGTSMCLWLASHVEVWTIRDGQVCSGIADWDKVKTSRIWRVPVSDWARATPSNTPSTLFDVEHGTLIAMRVPRSRRIDVAAIQAELARIYAPALRLGRHITWETWRPYRTERMALTTLHEIPPDARDFVLTLSTPTGDLFANGCVWLDPSATTEESQLAIAYGPRVIKRTRDCYGSQDGSEHFSGVGVVGFLDLQDGWRDYLTRGKSDIKDDEVYAAMMAALFEHLRPTLVLAEEQAARVMLDDLELNLALGLEGLFDIEVEVPAGPRAPEPQYTWTKEGHQDVPQITPVREPSTADGGTGGDARIETHKAGAQIYVDFQPDSKLSGLLFQPMISGDVITVLLNENHPDVIHARDRKTPTQQRMLYALMMPAVAALLLDSDTLRHRSLSLSVRKKLDDLPSDIEKLSYLTGLFLSSARTVA